MTRAVLSIGSNLGDRFAHLRSVLDALGERVVAVSPVYTTAPWGGVDQDDYLNAVVTAEDPAFDDYAWLRFGQELEQVAQRVREVRWGARTLDVDVVQCADSTGTATMKPFWAGSRPKSLAMATPSGPSSTQTMKLRSK
jgi:2-amino-4-hydroxy-6-hydroxymethyldihydropteridine diphosphokinase